MKYYKSPTFFILACFLSITHCAEISAKLKDHRQTKRAEIDNQWVHRDCSNLCPSQPEMMNDAIGRRQLRVLVPPESQGSCGSCWAFAATHTFADKINVEAASRTTAFSPDHLTRCSPYSREGNGCCGAGIESILYLNEAGAYPASCYGYTLKNYYIPSRLQEEKNTEERRAFKAANPLTCPTSCARDPRQLQDLVPISSANTSRVTEQLELGPLYATMLVQTDDYSSFINYSCGIFTDPNPFPTTELGGHAIELVDYSSPHYIGTPFYVAKNSWGATWGEKGYFRIAQNSKFFGKNFYAFIVSGANTDIPETPTLNPLARDSIVSCGAVKKDARRSALIRTAVEFGLRELSSQKLITCNASNTLPTLQLESIINATQQIVEGLIIDVAVRVKVTGCDENFAIVRLVIMQDMTDTLSLLDYTYQSGASTTTRTALLLFSSTSLSVALLLANMFDFY